MSSAINDAEEPSSTTPEDNAATKSEVENSTTDDVRPPAKRRLSSTVIEISDTESDDSDVCAVNSYQASADEVKRIRGGGLLAGLCETLCLVNMARNLNVVFIYSFNVFKRSNCSNLFT